MRGEGEERKGNPRVEGDDISRNLAHLICIYISRHKKCARYNEGQSGPLIIPLRSTAEILQCPPVRDASQRNMQVLVERLQIKLDTAAGIK